MAAVDIAIVSLGTTMGWRRADEALAEHVEAAGARCELRPIRLGAGARALQRTMLTIDVVQALAARRAAAGVDARAVVYSSVTAALLQPPRGRHAVRFDTIAALSRPGLGGAWQRRRERAVLGRADLLLPWSEAAGAAGRAAIGGGDPAGATAATAGPADAPGWAGARGRADRSAGVRGPADATMRPPQIVLPCVVDVAPEPATDAPDATAYAANPDKRGLDVLCAAWAEAAPPDARLLVGGIGEQDARAWLVGRGVALPPGVEFAGAVPRERWTALVAGSRVYVSAARYEDWGVAQMEALAAGTPLVASPTPGPNAALPIARELAPTLVARDLDARALADALRAGLALAGADRADYARRARTLLAPYSDAALRDLVAREVLPALLGPSG